jgi:hypothetical protein
MGRLESWCQSTVGEYFIISSRAFQIARYGKRGYQLT